MTMISAESQLSRDAKTEIQRRAAEAASTNDVVDAVFCALIESDIDQWNMSCEEWKGLLFEAFRAAKATRSQVQIPQAA